MKEYENTRLLSAPVIRDLQSGDCREGARLLAACFSDPWSREALEEACGMEDYLQLGAFLPAEIPEEADRGQENPGGEKPKVPCSLDKAPEGEMQDPILVGYGGLKMVLDEADVTNICVHPDYRRLGIGRDLLEAMLAMAGKRGIRRIYLEVRVSNQAAIHMYEEAGFKETGRRRGFYEKPREDALLMIWDQEKEEGPRD